jgi:hypothetical protein
MKRIFLGLVGGLVIYELVTLANEHDGDTISEIIWDATTQRPLVPFAAGVLCGHFFWQKAESKPRAGARARRSFCSRVFRARAQAPRWTFRSPRSSACPHSWHITRPNSSNHGRRGTSPVKCLISSSAPVRKALDRLGCPITR